MTRYPVRCAACAEFFGEVAVAGVVAYCRNCAGDHARVLAAQNLLKRRLAELPEGDPGRDGVEAQIAATMPKVYSQAELSQKPTTALPTAEWRKTSCGVCGNPTGIMRVGQPSAASPTTFCGEGCVRAWEDAGLADPEGRIRQTS